MKKKEKSYYKPVQANVWSNIEKKVTAMEINTIS